jgi:Ras family protein A
MARNIGAVYLECSARLNEGVQQVFYMATRAALETRKRKTSRITKKKCLVL